MTDREDLGHEPEETHDKRFAPVNRDANGRGRTVPRGGEGVPDEGQTVPAEEEGMSRQEDEAGGTATPGVDVGHPDAAPPD
ncbi:hypothetical protein [Spirillospora sp. NPDC029432]|uniref:hypothetical protein n=1 Tax=Spirillospora sp. NPDC029432 TaxID=3154599 RepID=UPI003454230A